jgi:hypothetical protein
MHGGFTPELRDDGRGCLEPGCLLEPFQLEHLDNLKTRRPRGPAGPARVARDPRRGAYSRTCTRVCLTAATCSVPAAQLLKGRTNRCPSFAAARGSGDRQDSGWRVPDRRCGPVGLGPAGAYPLPGRLGSGGGPGARLVDCQSGRHGEAVRAGRRGVTAGGRAAASFGFAGRATGRAFPGPFVAQPGQSLEDQVAALATQSAVG